MEDSPEFNIRFVSLIEKFPGIYDNTSPEYSNRNVQELAWEKIAKEMKATVAVCKERWKNLRGSYTRYLKKCTPSGSAAKKTRPYYLAEYMQFLTPFTKSRPMKSSLEPSSQQSIDYSCESNSGDNESQCENEEDNESQHVMALENESPLLSPTESNYSTGNTSSSVHNSQQISVAKKSRITPKIAVSLEEVNKSALEYFRSKRTSVEKASTITPYEDPDISFLMSMVPDMKKMNENQKRRFKIHMLSTAGNILEENINSSSTACNNDGLLTDLRTVTEPTTLAQQNLLEFLDFQRPERF